MRGRSRKTRKRSPKKTPAKKAASDDVSQPGTDESDAVPGSDFAFISQALACSLQSTPKRGSRQTPCTQEICLTSTPVQSSSADKVSGVSTRRARRAELEYTKVVTRSKTSGVDSPYGKSRSQSNHASKPRQVRKRVTKEKTQTRSKTSSPQAKCQRGKKRQTEPDTPSRPSKRTRPRFELKTPDAAEHEEPLLSSDLSIELSQHEERLPSLSFQEDEESDEEEELPSFSMQMDKKPPSIVEGAFVWHKCRNYPFWPALVKSVNRKRKKASIIFIENVMIHKKKGFSVPLKSLKPYDCEETTELVCKAKENDAAITCSMDLIEDYRIRIACGSFSGSFIEYFAHDMSYPVRRKYPETASERLAITSDTMMEESFEEEDIISEQQGEVSRSSQRLLPDRTHAAHNRANEKLVHFIVKQRMVEGHLLAVIRGQRQSRWLRSFLCANRRRVVNIYLEDDQQLDQVYCYLNELYTTAMASAPCPADERFMERVPFVLDVLLPEAITYAIAGVDKVSVKKAEEKYLKGRCISNRERQEFDLMIEREIKKKFQH